MFIGVLSLACGAAQFVFSAVDLARRGQLLRADGEHSGGRVDRRELSRERAAFQGTLLASAMLMVAALAYLLAHQRYLPYESGQSAYYRQHAVAQVGVASPVSRWSAPDSAGCAGRKRAPGDGSCCLP